MDFSNLIFTKVQIASCKLRDDTYELQDDSYELLIWQPKSKIKHGQAITLSFCA